MTLDPTQSTTESIYISWSHLVLTLETGASPVINYKIKSNQGESVNVWTDVGFVTASATPSFNYEGLTPGDRYSITVSAENIHGFGMESEVLVALAGDQPEQPSAI